MAMSSHRTRNDPRWRQRRMRARGQGWVRPVRSKPRKDAALCGLTTSPKRRPPAISWPGGPSTANRASATLPRRLPSPSWTGVPRMSPRIMAASGYARNDLVPDPAFHPAGIQALAADAEADDDAAVGDVLPGDPDQTGRGRPAAEDSGSEHRAGQEGG